LADLRWIARSGLVCLCCLLLFTGTLIAAETGEEQKSLLQDPPAGPVPDKTVVVDAVSTEKSAPQAWMQWLDGRGIAPSVA
jgi:hypothetical protein